MPMGEEQFSLTEFLLDDSLPEKGTEDHLKKWLEYKAGKGKDPDGTCEAFCFYASLWGVKIKSHKLVNTKPSPVEVQGDWMCSVWTTLSRGLKLVDSEALRESGITLSRYGLPTVNSCIKNGKLLENFDSFTIFKDQRVFDFIYNAYTRANLIIVPKGLNAARGNGPTYDYWDEALELLLQPTSDTTEDWSIRKHAESFQLLLEHFGISREDEVSKVEPSKAPLFFQDWIAGDGITEGWQVKKLLPNKDLTNYKDWKEEDWWKLVKEMTSRIVQRRETMQKYLAR